MAFNKKLLTEKIRIQIVDLYESEHWQLIRWLLQNYGAAAANEALKSQNWDAVNQAKGKAAMAVDFNQFIKSTYKEEMRKREKENARNNR